MQSQRFFIGKIENESYNQRLMLCETCGAHTINSKCPFESAKSWQEDYSLIGAGQMPQREHRMRVARWMLHHKRDFSLVMLEWAQMVIGIKVSA